MIRDSLLGRMFARVASSHCFSPSLWAAKGILLSIFKAVLLNEIGAIRAGDLAMILVAYRHGLRASELCGLRIADLDLESGSPDIRRLKGSLHRVQPLCRHKRTRDHR